MEEDNIIVPRWFLEVVENTLRIQYNINLDKKTGETCQDRNIKESLNGVRKLLKGEELTGGERLERLRPSLPSNLDEVAEEYRDTEVCTGSDYIDDDGDSLYRSFALKEAFKAGAKWRDAQIPKLPDSLNGAANNYCVDIRLGYPRVMDETDKYIFNAFKAGAEWMARQGDTREVGVNKQAEKDYIELAQLWVDSGNANVMSFKQFLKYHETQSNK